MRRRKHKLLLLIVTGSSILAVTGCDPAVQTTVLGGLQSASTGLITTFVQAFFQRLERPAPAPVTVQALQRQGSLRASHA